MHTVMWTFKVPAGTSKAQLVETINATAHTYEGIPGLIRKYYGIAPDGTSLVGIYLWDSKAAADAFYTADWVAMVTTCSPALRPGSTLYSQRAFDTACWTASIGVKVLRSQKREYHPYREQDSNAVSSSGLVMEPFQMLRSPPRARYRSVLRRKKDAP